MLTVAVIPVSPHLMSKDDANRPSPVGRLSAEPEAPQLGFLGGEQRSLWVHRGLLRWPLGLAEAGRWRDDTGQFRAGLLFVISKGS